jgi:hypothetical protein
MLVIRAPQMSALADAVRASYADSVTELVLFHLESARSMARDDVRERVHAAVKRAGRAGLVTERQVAMYVMAEWMCGENFLENMGLSTDRTWGELSPEGKAQVLEGILNAMPRPGR